MIDFVDMVDKHTGKTKSIISLQYLSDNQSSDIRERNKRKSKEIKDMVENIK